MTCSSGLQASELFWPDIWRDLVKVRHRELQSERDEVILFFKFWTVRGNTPLEKISKIVDLILAFEANSALSHQIALFCRSDFTIFLHFCQFSFLFIFSWSDSKSSPRSWEISSYWWQVFGLWHRANNGQMFSLCPTQNLDICGMNYYNSVDAMYVVLQIRERESLVYSTFRHLKNSRDFKPFYIWSALVLTVCFDKKTFPVTNKL